MRIPQSNVTLVISDEEALGILLSTLTAVMKASKTNSAAPINHLLKERLSLRRDRGALNAMLFAMTKALAKDIKKPPAKMTKNTVRLDDSGNSDDPDPSGIPGWFDNTKTEHFEQTSVAPSALRERSVKELREAELLQNALQASDQSRLSTKKR